MAWDRGGFRTSSGISLDEAKRFIEEYFEKYPGVKSYIDAAIAGARRGNAPRPSSAADGSFPRSTARTTG